MERQLLDVGQGVLHGAGEAVEGHSSLTGGGLHRHVGSLFDAVPLQSRDLHHRTAQNLRKLFGIEFVAAAANHVHHVHRHHHRKPQLHELGGEVEVPLQVGAVDDIEDGVRPLLDQIVAGHHFLQSVGAQGIDARQVHHRHILVALEAALLLLHGDAGPVAHKLIGTRQGIEQGRLAGVGVTGKGDFDLHGMLPPK